MCCQRTERTEPPRVLLTEPPARPEQHAWGCTCTSDPSRAGFWGFFMGNGQALSHPPHFPLWVEAMGAVQGRGANFRAISQLRAPGRRVVPAVRAAPGHGGGTCPMCSHREPCGGGGGGWRSTSLSALHSLTGCGGPARRERLRIKCLDQGQAGGQWLADSRPGLSDFKVPVGMTTSGRRGLVHSSGECWGPLLLGLALNWGVALAAPFPFLWAVGPRPVGLPLSGSQIPSPAGSRAQSPHRPARWPSRRKPH